MNITMKVKDFVISADSEKEAYIKGCKSLAKYMASKKYKNLSFQIKRSGAENEFIFTAFTNIDLGENQREFCKICKKFHCSFFINEEYNCSRCNLKSFLTRVEEKARTSRSFYRSKMKEK